ncbi:uridylate kinase [Fusarium albosuccineum]|uniref:Uridylate kinase n=1 Tax=Fusarium albosuccineum TaxID=1237068 RepID=A0A8H4P737_9HYPO|nr:uridylate kinase [Fusarium albosuccineum]
MANSKTRVPYDSNTPLFISIMGGPGSGKGTQCKLIAQSFNIGHVSIGQMLHGEMNTPRSPHASVIRGNMLAGTAAPKEVINSVLVSHVLKTMGQGIGVFLLDGYPRNLDELRQFENIFGPIRVAVVLRCSEHVMMNRLVNDTLTDHVTEIIAGRLRTFQKETSLVVEHFHRRNTLRVLDGEQSIEVINQQLKTILSEFSSFYREQTVDEQLEAVARESKDSCKEQRAKERQEEIAKTPGPIHPADILYYGPWQKYAR